MIRIDRIASEKIREKKKKVDEKKKRKEIEIMNGLFLSFVKKMKLSDLFCLVK